MGRQQSFVKFNDLETLKNELVKYSQRDSSQDSTYVINTVEVIKTIRPFKKGEIALVLGGERYGQRNASNLEEETGIQNAERIVFIDNEDYWMKAAGKGMKLGQFLDAHFKAMENADREKYNIINF